MKKSFLSLRCGPCSLDSAPERDHDDGFGVGAPSPPRPRSGPRAGRPGPGRRAGRERAERSDQGRRAITSRAPPPPRPAPQQTQPRRRELRDPAACAKSRPLTKSTGIASRPAPRDLVVGVDVDDLPARARRRRGARSTSARICLAEMTARARRAAAGAIIGSRTGCLGTRGPRGRGSRSRRRPSRSPSRRTRSGRSRAASPRRSRRGRTGRSRSGSPS